MSPNKAPYTKEPKEADAIPGISGIPAGVTPEIVVFLEGLIASFNKSAQDLQKAYSALQGKFDKLNLRLEETNRELRVSLDEQERLSNYLTNILESLSTGVLVVDTSEMITLFNRGAELMTGRAGASAINKQYREVMGTGMSDELTPLGALSEGMGGVQMEKTIVAQTGETIPVGYAVTPLVNSTGDQIGAVEIFMDMRRIKALEDEISRMDKLAALGQMSATMAHKIRNPLGGIVGYAGLLDRQLGENDKGKTHIRRIIDGVDKINHIITSVLAYNSQLKLVPRTIDLSERIDELISLVKQDNEEIDCSHIGFTVSEPAEPVIIEADADQINNALLTIFRNAIEAIEDDGGIDVRIMTDKVQRSTSCPLTSRLLDKMREGSRLMKSRRQCGIITITDSGGGMDDDIRQNLFVPFFTTKEKGIGLGLASARKIIDAHHGEIWLESTAELGTAVGIILPVKSTLKRNVR